jgi:16S rRNA G527 N7-methylase RsmG
VLIDSNHKKARFLQQVAIELGLATVKTVTARVEGDYAASMFDVDPFARVFRSFDLRAIEARGILRKGGRCTR